MRTNNNASASYIEAEELLGRGKFLLALDKYEFVAEHFETTPFAPLSLYKKALIYNRFLLDKRKAVDAYYKVLSVYPEAKEAYKARQDLAAIYSAAGDHTKAVEQYQWILDSRVEPLKADDYRYIIALEYFKMSDFEQAGAELKELLGSAEKKDIIAKALLLRGDTFYITGKTTEAIKNFEEIISRFPEETVAVRASFNLAKALEDSDKEDEALVILQSLRDTYPNKDVLESTIKGIKTRMRAKKAKRSKRSRR
ncbi:MAG: tetratricopeptide repeat protein [Thermodesulfobacteriota bacterium]